MTSSQSLAPLIGKMVGCGRLFTSTFLFNRSNEPVSVQTEENVPEISIQTKPNVFPEPIIKNPPAKKAGDAEEKNTTKASRSKNFDEFSKGILMDWLIQHKDKPYASITQRRELSKLTGLSEKQIKTWLTNARIRQRTLLGGVPELAAKKASHQSAMAKIKILEEMVGQKS